MLTVLTCTSCQAPVRRLSGGVNERVLCPSCTESGVEAMRALVADQAAQSLEQRLGRFDGSGAYGSAVLSEHPTSRWERIAVEAVNAHRTALEQGTVSRAGLVLIGPAGVGKTRAAIALCRSVGAFDPSGVLMVTENELLAPEVPPWELLEHIRRLVSGRRCVAIDDIGAVARPADQVMAAWKYLLDILRAADQPMLLVGTTNRLSWSERGGLVDWMGAQAVSRLREHCEMGTTGWTDYRTGHIHEQWRSMLTQGK